MSVSDQRPLSRELGSGGFSVIQQYAGTKVFETQGLMDAFSYKIRISLIAFSFAVTSITVPLRLEAVELREQVLAEYGPFYERIIRSYSRIQLSAEKEVRSGAGGLAPVGVLEYRANGSLMRVDTRPMAIDKSNRPLKAIVANPAGDSFTVRGSEDGPWALFNISANPGAFMDSIRLYCPVAVGPWSFYEWDLADFLKNDQVSITSFEKQPGDVAESAKVDFEFHINTERTWKGYFVFDVANSWVLDHWAYNSARCKLRYKGSVQGVPLIASFATWVDPDESEERPRERFTVRDIKTVPADKAEFTLASFGLHAGRIRGRNHMWAIALGIGIALLLGGVLLRRRAQQRQ